MATEKLTIAAAKDLTLTASMSCPPSCKDPGRQFPGRSLACYGEGPTVNGSGWPHQTGTTIEYTTPSSALIPSVRKIPQRRPKRTTNATAPIITAPQFTV